MDLVRYQSERGEEPFTDWLIALSNKRVQARIRVRLLRVEAGNFGDCKSVGDGVSELRIDEGPGYRIYFGRHGQVVVVLLCGGDKGSQARDIDRAKNLWSEWKRRQT